MKNLKEKINSLGFALSLRTMNLKTRAKKRLSEEDGDTNFLSIIIILAIVLIVAVVFIAFKDQIIGLLKGAWDDFKSAFDSQDKTGLGG